MVILSVDATMIVYLSEPRAEEAGIITLGHHVNNAMIIPPRTSRHNIAIWKVWGSVYFSGKNQTEP